MDIIYSIKSSDAKAYGLNEALMLSVFRELLAHNKAYRRLCTGKRVWVSGSLDALHELVPCLTRRQIRYAIDKLVDAGVLVKAKLSDDKLDRTNWYSLPGMTAPEDDEQEHYDTDSETPSDKSVTPSDKIVKCIYKGLEKEQPTENEDVATPKQGEFPEMATSQAPLGALPPDFPPSPHPNPPIIPPSHLTPHDINPCEQEPDETESDQDLTDMNKRGYKWRKDKTRAEDIRALGDLLIGIVQERRQMNWTPTKKNVTYDHIDKLHRLDGVVFKRIHKALTWYAHNWEGQYVPVIESGASLRRKFGKLEDAIKRATGESDEDNGFKSAKGKSTW